MIRDVHPGSGDPNLDFLLVPDPGIKKAPDPVSRIRIRNTEGSLYKNLTPVLKALQ